MTRWLLCSVLLVVGACADSPSGVPPPPSLDAAAGDDAAAAVDASPDAGSSADATLDAGPGDAASPDAQAAPDAMVVVTSTDPFAPLPADSAGLTNVATDLRAVLENGALGAACAAWEADPSDRRKRLMCGKAMFFYESFGTVGLPLAIVESLIENFPEIGPGFTGVGLIEDPYSATHLPLGVSTPVTSTSAPASLALTCASCHFARLADGRYAVGAPNHSYDYGKHILSLVLLPQLARSNPDLSAHHPAAIEALRPMYERLQADRGLRIRVLLDLLPLLSLVRNGMVPTLTREDEGAYASWLTGTQDFTLTPVPIDDRVHTVSKISALWSIPTVPEWTAQGMPSAMLGWTGESPSVEQFVHDFVVLGAGALTRWPESRLAPLVEYVYSLRPPMPPTQDAVLVSRGRALFASEGCLGCHDGPRGSGKRLYDYAEIGTDDAMRAWMDPDLDGQPCCNLPIRPGVVLRHQLKSPRMLGLWSAQRFLHNGAVPTIEALLCLDGPRGGVLLPPFGDQGHTYGCVLPREDKAALAAFLRSH